MAIASLALGLLFWLIPVAGYNRWIGVLDFVLHTFRKVLSHFFGYKNSDIATIIGIISCEAVAGLLAVIFGHLAKASIRRSEGRLVGRGMASVGLILGYLGLAAVGMVLVFFWWLMGQPPPQM